ncbi:hypothetical protein Lpp41_08488 [Lacticaseibacillus paracasei subsp. paracasei Lpp41]|uniref:Phosphoribosylformylglycinamidine synthase n=1 Tax=Lacticaseibacillus paracasei subsp. paracasei Lpp41 TaxID=1256208 RepID=A0A829H784_LACPA|nr:hypothetical protein Lpp41_08488 [Lacticaseibacillus paracasei subsp. paracasei Lpp41]
MPVVTNETGNVLGMMPHPERAVKHCWAVRMAWAYSNR